MHTQHRERPLAAIRQKLAGLGFQNAAVRLALTLKYNPNWHLQPRVPRGNPDGGQWTDGVQLAAFQTLIPVIQRTMPFAQRLVETGKRVAPYLRKMPKRWDPLDGFPSEDSFDPETRRIGPNSRRRGDHEYLRFTSESEFKRYLGRAPAEHHQHHIVEQRLVKEGVFPPEVIYSTDNVVVIHKRVHGCINGKMGSKWSGTDTLTRHFIQDWPFWKQYNFGLWLIEICRRETYPVPNK